MCEHHSLFFPRVFFMPVFYARSSTGQSSLNVLRTHTKKKKTQPRKKREKKNETQNYCTTDHSIT